MGVEEVGVKFTVEDEQAFYKAMDKAQAGITDFDRALAKMAQQQEAAAMLDRVKAKLAGMTEAEKFAAVEAVKMADETEKASKVTADMADSGKRAHLSLTDIKSGFEMAINGAKQAYAFFRQFIDAASDLNETVSKSQVVFGDSAKAVEEMGNRAAASMGMSKNAAIGAAATYGNLFVSMGLAKDKSAEMSINMVQLAADFASFNNLPTADVLEKIRAGLTGESEPLKALGVNINEAAIKQEAMNLGLTKGKGTLDAATKAQAVYSLILKQSTTAQGDFARTADGVANKQRTIEARTEDLTASIGKRLLPVWNTMLDVFDKAIGSLGLLATAQERYIDVLNIHHTEMQKGAKTYDEYVTEMNRAARAAGLLITASGDLVEIQDNGMGASIQRLIQKNYLWSKTNFEVQQGLAETEKAAEGARDGTDRLADAMYNADDATVDLAQSLQDNLNQQLKDLDALIAGQVGKTIEEFDTKLGDLRKTGYGLESQIAALEKLQYMTPEQKVALGELKGKLEENRGKMNEVATAFEDAAKRMLFAMIEQKVASDGLTTDEVANLTTLALHWGLVDQATANTALMINGIDLSTGKLELSTFDFILGSVTGNSYNAAGQVVTAADRMNEIRLGVARGELAPIDQLLRSIMSQPSTKTVDVYTHYHEIHDATGNNPGYGGNQGGGAANGANYIVPAGFPNDSYLQPVSSGEHVIVLPAEVDQLFNRTIRAIGGAMGQSYSSSISNSSQNNYNLQVMTNQSPAVVQQSFEMMRMLAG